jgi:membrane-bound serine protease (ClpP class)
MKRLKIIEMAMIFTIVLLLFSLIPMANLNGSNNSKNVTTFQTVSGKNVVLINFDLSIDPGASSMMKSALSGLNNKTTEAVVIEMNTPGGLLTSMLDIMEYINNTESSGIPVYTFITSNGLGNGAGTFIAMESDQIWMSQSSAIGSATPSEDISSLDAIIVGLAQVHDRNISAVQNMVCRDVAYSAQAAYKSGISNGTTNTLNGLLTQLNLAGYHQQTISESIFDQFISFISNAVIDGLFISFGSLAILLDLYHRTVFMTLLGLGLIIVGFLGAQYIDASVVGLIFLIMGTLLIFLESKTGHGIALISGIAVDIMGTLFLISPQFDLTAQPYSSGYSPSPINSDFIISAILLLIIGVFIAYYINRIVKSQVRKPTTGWESMVGNQGTADTDIDPEGWVSLEGVRWKARSERSIRIEKGEKIVIVGINNLTVIVKRDDQSEHNGI